MSLLFVKYFCNQMQCSLHFTIIDYFMMFHDIKSPPKCKVVTIKGLKKPNKNSCFCPSGNVPVVLSLFIWSGSRNVTTTYIFRWKLVYCWRLTISMKPNPDLLPEGHAFIPHHCQSQWNYIVPLLQHCLLLPLFLSVLNLSSSLPFLLSKSLSIMPSGQSVL